jgi:Zn-dependent protease with chaperone function
MLLSPEYMKTEISPLPSRKWSIVALGSAGMTAVVLSYLLAILLAVACLALPYVMFVLIPFNGGGLLVARVLLSAFGLVAGLTILWSLVPRKDEIKVNGVLIDLKKEPRLGAEIESVAAALNEPMPSEVYLLGEANAFVMERGGFAGFGKQRTIGLGLPLLQMLTIAQFRAVLAHEFAHYYAGDTRLGPWVYNTRKAIGRVYENMGRKSDVLTFLRRWAVVAAPYMLLMGAMRMYWMLFMRITQAISRRQEFRSDELACHIAGSQPLIEGLESINRCQSALSAYWNSVVLPVAVGGFQPQIADGFMRFMNAPQVAKATSEHLAKVIAVTKPSPMDTHPPLPQRIERARLYNLGAADLAGQSSQSDLPTISLLDDLASLEAGLLRKFVPSLATAQLKPLAWESAGIEVYVPRWRKQVETHAQFLSAKTVKDLPGLLKEPREISAISNAIADPPGRTLTPAQRYAGALDVLYCAMAACLLDHGWALQTEPGIVRFECAGNQFDPGASIAAIKAGKLAATDWESECAQRGCGDWPLASQAAS